MRKRKMLSQQEWRRLIEEQAASGQTIVTFCRDQGIKEHSFYRHKSRLRESKEAAGFREIKVSRCSAIRVLVSDGMSRVEVASGFDAALLRAVVEALR